MSLFQKLRQHITIFTLLLVLLLFFCAAGWSAEEDPFAPEAMEQEAKRVKELTRQEMLNSAAERIKILEEKQRAEANERPSQTTPRVQEQTKPTVVETPKPETRGEVASAGSEPNRQEIIRLAAERIKILEEKQRDESQAKAALLKAAQPQPAIQANAPRKNIEQPSKQPTKPAPAPEQFEKPTIVQPEHDALIRKYIELYYRRF